MKSAVITVTSSGQGIIEALSMTERVGTEFDLAKKQVLHLRLLAEELFGMLRSIAGNVEATYWLDVNEKNFELHMKSNVDMNTEKREQLLSASSSGKNEATKGFMGKIRDMIADMMLSAYDAQTYSMFNTSYFIPIDDFLGEYVWSMNYYIQEIQRDMDSTKEAAEAWDELEKSIVASIADDIKVKIKGKNVELIIYKAF